MNISIIGAGRIGLALGAVLADKGHFVLFTDRDSQKLKDLSRGKISFYEPGLKSFLRQNKSRLKWTEDSQEIISSKMIFLTLNLPIKPNGDFDLSGIKDWTHRIIRQTQREKILILKSTVPPGTNRMLQFLAKKAGAPLQVVSCPEFLRQGQALYDIQNPYRSVIAGPSPKINKKVARIYKNFSASPIIFASPETAEIGKLAANSFLALKISFVNLMANLTEYFDTNGEELRRILGSDPRIGHQFLQSGLGFGGSCLPKDLRHLTFQGRRHGISMRLLKEVDALNRQRSEHFFQQIKQRHKNLRNKTYALWGLSFKPGTEDIRLSPSVFLAQKLLETGAHLKIFDPLLKTESSTPLSSILGKKGVKAQITFHKNPLSSLNSAHGLIVGTNWKGLGKIPLKEIKTRLKTPFIVDGRGVFNVKELKKKGFTVYQSGLFRFPN